MSTRHTPAHDERLEARSDSPAVGGVIKSITDDVKALVTGEIELAKAELIPSAKNAGKGAGMLGAAGYFGINGLTLLYIAAALGLYALGLPPWLAFLIVAAVLLLIAGVLALVGLRAVKKVKGPEKTIAQANQTVSEVKGAVQHATAAATAPQIEGKVVHTKALR
jgi:membrane protein implicated in regulation of membrane protease activity